MANLNYIKNQHLASKMTVAEATIPSAMCSINVAGHYVTGLTDLGTVSTILKEVMIPGVDYVGAGKGLRVRTSRLDDIAERVWLRKVAEDAKREELRKPVQVEVPWEGAKIVLG